MNTYPTFIAAFVDQLISAPALAAVLVVMIIAFSLPRIRDFKKDTGHMGSSRPLPQILGILAPGVMLLIAGIGMTAYTDTQRPKPRTLSAAWDVIHSDDGPDLLLNAIHVVTGDGKYPLSDYRLNVAVANVAKLQTNAKAERAASFLELERLPPARQPDAGSDPSAGAREQLLTLLNAMEHQEPK